MHTPEGRHLSELLLATFHLPMEYVVSKLSNRFCHQWREMDSQRVTHTSYLRQQYSHFL